MNAPASTKTSFKPVRLADLKNKTTITILIGPYAWAEGKRRSEIAGNTGLRELTGDIDPFAAIDGDMNEQSLIVTDNIMSDPAKLARMQLATEKTQFIYLESCGEVSEEHRFNMVKVLIKQAPSARIEHDGNSLHDLMEVAAKLDSHDETGEEASGIAEQIKRGLIDKLTSVGPSPDPDMLKPDTAIIEKMINRSFWSGQKSKLFMLNRDESLNQFSSAEAFKFLCKAFGSVVNDAALDVLACDAMEGAKRSEIKRFKSELTAAIRDPILDHIKDVNQRDTIAWAVDMFALAGAVQLIEDKAKVTLSHKPLKIDTPLLSYDPAVIADYKRHFTRFDEFLTFITMARFAQDRKKAYLWIHASSDWGKGFLKAVLSNLGLCVELSVKEIERIFEGGPVAKSPMDFRRAFALVVDEFKSVKSEIKQLESSIRISPKNQLQSEVEVFAKLFLSAEGVASLAGENGVEDQFANRLSCFQEYGELTKRQMFIELGSSAYLAHVTLYAAEYINNLVDEMRRKGRMVAATEAEQFLNGFIKRNGLDTVYERFSASFPALAENIVSWVQDPKGGGYSSDIIRTGTAVYLKSANKVIGNYINDHYDRSEAGSLHRKKDDLANHMSIDGKGIASHKINGKVVKAIKLKTE